MCTTSQANAYSRRDCCDGWDPNVKQKVVQHMTTELDHADDNDGIVSACSHASLSLTRQYVE